MVFPQGLRSQCSNRSSGSAGGCELNLTPDFGGIIFWSWASFDILVHFGILSIFGESDHILGTSCQQPCWDCSGGCWYPLPLAVEAGSSLALCSLPMPPNYVKPSESVANRPPKPTQTALKHPKISLQPPKIDIYSVKVTALLAKETSLILTPKHTNTLNTRAISCV